MKNALYVLIVLLVFSCKTTEVVKKPTIKKTSLTEYNQYIKDTKLLFLDKIPNKIRIYGQILCPGAIRRSLGIDRPFELKDDLFDLSYRPQICGSFEYGIRKVVNGDTLLIKKSIDTDAKGRFDIILDYGHYLLQPKLDADTLREFESKIQAPAAQKYFHSVVKATWVVISEKDTAISLNLGAIREDRFKSILAGFNLEKRPDPMHTNKNF